MFFWSEFADLAKSQPGGVLNMLHHWYKQSNSGELFLKSRKTKRNSLPKFYVLAEAVGDCAFELPTASMHE
mgnify:CR=1 FL=1